MIMTALSQIRSRFSLRGPVPPLWLMLLSMLLFFTFLGKSPIYILDEVKNAQCAREMMEKKQWIVPTFNGQLRVAKPPAHYYFIQAGYRIWGTGNFGARFFSAIAGCILIWATYRCVALFANRRYALFTSLVLLSSTHIVFEFRLAVPDPYLILFNVLTLFGGYGWMTTGRKSWLWLAAACTGLGILTKGPVSILLPGMVVLVWTAWERRWRQLLKPELIAAALIVLIVAAPWYFLVDRATSGAWTRGFFIDNNLNRFSAPMEGHGGPFFLVPVFILLGLLPATVFVAEVLRRRPLVSLNAFTRFAIVVAVVYLVFYSFSGTKLPNYPMPMYPFAAFLLGSWMSDAIDSGKKTARYPLFILAFIALAIPIAAWIALSNEPGLESTGQVSLWLLVLPAGVLYAVYLLWKKGLREALAAVCATYAFFHILFFAYLYPTVYKQNPVDRSLSLLKNRETIVAYRAFNPAFVFRQKSPIAEFSDTAALESQLVSTPDAVVISRSSHEAELRALGLETIWKGKDLFEHHTTVLMSRASD
jgi:4-amino-4-deoxy-L-arabinose transferase-like glycosyltransferase